MTVSASALILAAGHIAAARHDYRDRRAVHGFGRVIGVSRAGSVSPRFGRRLPQMGLSSHAVVDSSDPLPRGEGIVRNDLFQSEAVTRSGRILLLTGASINSSTRGAIFAAHPGMVMLEGWAKVSAFLAAETRGQRRISILRSNGDIFLPEELVSGADGVMTCPL